MKLGSRKFLRPLRRRVRREVKARPEWRQEARRLAFSKINRAVPYSVLRWVPAVILAGLALSRPSAPGLWLVLALWANGLVLFRLAQLQQFFGQREGAAVFWGLPVSATQVFGLGIGQAFRTSLWLLFDLLVALAFATPFAAASLGTWLGVVFAALLTWLSVLATVIILIYRWPGASYRSFGTTLFTIGFVVLMALRAAGLRGFERFDGLYQVLAWVTPPGWALQFAAWVTGTGVSFPVAPLGLLAVWIAFSVPCYRAMLGRFTFWEPEQPHLPLPPEDAPLVVTARPEDYRAADASGNEAPDFVAGEEEGPLPDRASEVADLVRTRAFLQPLTHSPKGWIERFIFSKMSRQSTLLSFLLGTEPGWSRSFRTGIWLLLLAPLFGRAVAFVAPSFSMWAVWLTVIGAIGCTTPLFAGSWPGFNLGPLGHRNVAVLSLLPIGLRDVRQVVITVNALRYLLALPFWLIGAALASAYTSAPNFPGALLLGAEIWLISLLLQPFFLIFKYSAGTNDSSKGCLSGLLFLTACFIPIGALGGVLLAIFAPASPIALVIAYGALALTSFGCEAAYRAVYNRHFFDLLAKTERG